MKSEYQIETEKELSQLKRVERREISGESDMHHPSLKVGDIITVGRWGTFGCWDEKGRWVDYYKSKPAKK